MPLTTQRIEEIKKEFYIAQKSDIDMCSPTHSAQLIADYWLNILSQEADMAEKRGYDNAFATIPNPLYSQAEVDRLLEEQRKEIELLIPNERKVSVFGDIDKEGEYECRDYEEKVLATGVIRTILALPSLNKQ